MNFEIAQPVMTNTAPNNPALKRFRAACETRDNCLPGEGTRISRQMFRLREALEASWDGQTAYRAVGRAGNPAFGQCYPTSRVVQHYYPATEIIRGKVWTGESEVIHFWNGLHSV
jgi:hypothetical protein